MTRQEQQKLSILVVLVAVLAVTLWLSYRGSPAATAAVQPPAAAVSANVLPTASDARIRLDIVDKPEGSEAGVGRKDLFRYRQALQPRPQASRPLPPAAMPSVMTAPAASAPVLPPPPPSIPLQYQGFAVDKSAEGGFIAFLAEGTSKHYNVRVGEVLMGRYRIARISETAVEVEDLEYNRRQTLPVLK